jgi:hypothetical protein
MRLGYAKEKLTDAVYSLATGADRVQERLSHAAADVLIRLRPDDFPEGELRRKFIGIWDDLTFDQPTANEGNIAATLNRTDDEDARAIARRILSLYSAISRLAD